jgi:hypothetical protein
MAKGQSHSNREAKKPKKSKEIIVQASSLSVTPPKGGSQTAEVKKK